MLGPRKKPMFAGKAGETKGLVEFCVQELEAALPTLARAQTLKARLLLAAGKSALIFDRDLHAAPVLVDRVTRQKLLQQYLHFGQLLQRASARTKPKFHLMVHGIQRIGRANQV